MIARKISVLFFTILFVFCMSSAAMADTITTGTVDINAGAGAEATIIGAQSGPSTAITGPSTAITGPSTAITGPSTAVTGPSSAEANIDNITAATGPSSAEISGVTAATGPSSAIVNQKFEGANVQRPYPNPPSTYSPPLTQDFSQTDNYAWNINIAGMVDLFKNKSVWTKAEVDAWCRCRAKIELDSHRIYNFPSTQKIRVIVDPKEALVATEKTVYVPVGEIVFPAENSDHITLYTLSAYVLKQALFMGGDIVKIVGAGGVLESKAGGGGIGFGALAAGSDNGLISHVGTGYNRAWNSRVRHASIDAIVYREVAVSDMVSLTPAIIPSDQEIKKTPEGIWIDDAGMPRFPWEKAYGAGVINGK